MTHYSLSGSLYLAGQCFLWLCFYLSFPISVLPLYTFILLCSLSLLFWSQHLSHSESFWSLPVGVYVGDNALQPAGLCIEKSFIFFKRPAGSRLLCVCACIPFYFWDESTLVADIAESHQRRNRKTEITSIFTTEHSCMRCNKFSAKIKIPGSR